MDGQHTVDWLRCSQQPEGPLTLAIPLASDLRPKLNTVGWEGGKNEFGWLRYPGEVPDAAEVR